MVETLRRKLLGVAKDPGNVATITAHEARAAIAEAEKAGHDLSLVDCSLAVTPAERYLRHAAALEFPRQLRQRPRLPRRPQCSPIMG